jgi:DNA-binding XRE family transcriptional regulator
MHIAFMSNPSDRLVKARIRLYATAADAARALGMQYPTYAAHENGSRGFSDNLDRYARAFKVRAEWLRSGMEPMKSGEQPPIVAKLEELPPEKRKQVFEYIEFLKQSG